MPVDPDYIYADTVHKKTAIDGFFRYSCHSRNVGSGPRGETVQWEFQAGWAEDGRRVMVKGATEWKPMLCGHIEQPGIGSDPHCEGCANRRW